MFAHGSLAVRRNHECNEIHECAQSERRHLPDQREIEKGAFDAPSLSVLVRIAGAAGKTMR
jgi:hypothetical protein